MKIILSYVVDVIIGKTETRQFFASEEEAKKYLDSIAVAAQEASKPKKTAAQVTAQEVKDELMSRLNSRLTELFKAGFGNQEIANVLNRERYTTQAGHEFNYQRVADYLHNLGLRRLGQRSDRTLEGVIYAPLGGRNGN